MLTCTPKHVYICPHLCNCMLVPPRVYVTCAYKSYSIIIPVWPDSYILCAHRYSDYSSLAQETVHDPGSRIKSYSIFDRNFPPTIPGLNPWGRWSLVSRPMHRWASTSSQISSNRDVLMLTNSMNSLIKCMHFKNPCPMSLQSYDLGICRDSFSFFPFSYMPISGCVFVSIWGPILCLPTGKEHVELDCPTAIKWYVRCTHLESVWLAPEHVPYKYCPTLVGIPHKSRFLILSFIHQLIGHQLVGHLKKLFDFQDDLFLLT